MSEERGLLSTESAQNFYVYNDDQIDRSMDHGCGREDVNTGEWTACAECADRLSNAPAGTEADQ